MLIFNHPCKAIFHQDLTKALSPEEPAANLLCCLSPMPHALKARTSKQLGGKSIPKRGRSVRDVKEDVSISARNQSISFTFSSLIPLKPQCPRSTPARRDLGSDNEHPRVRLVTRKGESRRESRLWAEQCCGQSTGAAASLRPSTPSFRSRKLPSLPLLSKPVCC